jgi:hypothetical protein
MDVKKRALLGALSGAGGTLALTGFRKSLNQLDVVHRTAPQKVVDRLEELGLLDGWTRERRRTLMIAAHYGYGVGAGTAFGLLRRQERGELLTEVAVGAALGVLSWGAGWTTWLPLLGTEDAPWDAKTTEVLLPVLDHAVFGAFWGATWWALHRSEDGLSNGEE